MGKSYFDNSSYNVAFERCIDVLAELIEKYAGKFAMDDIGYDYCVYIGNTPVTLVYSYKNLGDRLKDYYRQCYHNQDSGMKSEPKSRIIVTQNLILLPDRSVEP